MICYVKSLVSKKGDNSDKTRHQTEKYKLYHLKLVVMVE